MPWPQTPSHPTAGTFPRDAAAATGLSGGRVKLTQIGTKQTRLKHCLPGDQAVLRLSTPGHPAREALTDFWAPSCHWAYRDTDPEVLYREVTWQSPALGRDEQLITCSSREGIVPEQVGPGFSWKARPHPPPQPFGQEEKQMHRYPQGTFGLRSCPGACRP